MNSFAKFLLLGSLLVISAVSMADFELSGRLEADLKRDKTSKPREIIQLVGVKPGDHVLDLFAGGGYYSEILSRVVGDKGEVVLHNNNAYLGFVGVQLSSRLSSNRLKNVTRLDSEADDLKLGENRFDSAFVILGVHDMYFKDKGWDVPVTPVMTQLYNSLKPGGRLVVIDHNNAKGRGIKDAKSLHRVESSVVATELQKIGFKLVIESDLLRNPEDDYSKSVFAPEIRRKTDRFIFIFEKAE